MLHLCVYLFIYMVFLHLHLYPESCCDAEHPNQNLSWSG
uniref:Uncharacterized protein n=1 Tax=Arundo donax TaxID=35708 RepID=A0A0A9HIP5_ARUDO